MIITAQQISESLSGKRCGNGYQANCPAHKDKTPSLSISEKNGRVLVKCHAGCDQESVIAELKKLHLWPARFDFESEYDALSSAQSKWQAAIPLDHPDAIFAKKYWESRGLNLFENLNTIRFIPSMGYFENRKRLGQLPALLAKIVDLDSTMLGLQRIYLDRSGSKMNPIKEFPAYKDKEKLSPKKILGNSKGGAVRLGEADRILCVTEGIETGLAVQQATGLPCWAAVSAGGMETLEIPSSVKELRIWFDIEPSGTGRCAAEKLASRYSKVGLRCFLHNPSQSNEDKIDWLDVLNLQGPSAFEISIKETKQFEISKMDCNPSTNDDWKKISSPKKFELVHISELMKRPTEQIEYVVADSLPFHGSSVVAGKPKAGKTTLVRYLALCVATGRPFLGKDTTRGRVIYLALEEKESQVKEHFIKMGAVGDEDILLHVSSAPTQDVLDQLYALIKEHTPVLVIIDTLHKLIRIDDMNDYAKVNKALEPISNMARITGTHILLVHHMGKADREGADQILGSTAIAGAVDSIFMIKRSGQKRTICSQQRYGIDLEECLLIFDSEKRTFSLGAGVDGETDGDIEHAIIIYLRDRGCEVKEAELHKQIQGRHLTKVHTLRELVRAGSIHRSGKGGKGNPFMYSIPNNDFEVPQSPMGEQGNKNVSDEEIFFEDGGK